MKRRRETETFPLLASIIHQPVHCFALAVGLGAKFQSSANFASSLFAFRTLVAFISVVYVRHESRESSRVPSIIDWVWTFKHRWAFHVFVESFFIIVVLHLCRALTFQRKRHFHFLSKDAITLMAAWSHVIQTDVNQPANSMDERWSIAAESWAAIITLSRPQCFRLRLRFPMNSSIIIPASIINLVQLVALIRSTVGIVLKWCESKMEWKLGRF